MAIRTDGSEEPLQPTAYIPDALVWKENADQKRKLTSISTGKLLQRAPLRAGKKSTGSKSTVIRIDPSVCAETQTMGRPFNILEAKYWALRSQFSKNCRAAGVGSDQFIPSLIKMMYHSYNDTLQTQTVNTDKTHWTTRPSLMRILVDIFELNTELYSNALNASDFLDHHHSITPGDRAFGMLVGFTDMGCLGVSWDGMLAYANPEYEKAQMEAFFDKVGMTIRTAKLPTRIVSVLPTGPKAGTEGGTWNTEEKVKESGGNILFRFPAGSFSFLSDRYWRGDADDGIRTIPNEVLIVSWEANSPPEYSADELTQKVRLWSKYYTTKVKLPPPIQSRGQAAIAAIMRRSRADVASVISSELADNEEGTYVIATSGSTRCPVCKVAGPYDKLKVYATVAKIEKPIVIRCVHGRFTNVTLADERERRNVLRRSSKFDRPRVEIEIKKRAHPIRWDVPNRKVTFPFIAPYLATPFLGPEMTGQWEKTLYGVELTPAYECRAGYLAPNCGLIDREVARKAHVSAEVVEHIANTILKGSLWMYDKRNTMFHEVDPESWEAQVPEVPEEAQVRDLAAASIREKLRKADLERERPLVQQANQQWMAGD
jgi:hypothetical protein